MFESLSKFFHLLSRVFARGAKSKQTPIKEFERPPIKQYALGDGSANKEIVGSITESALTLKCHICQKSAVSFILDESGALWINSAIRSFPLFSPITNRIIVLLEDLKEGRYQKVHRELVKVCEGLDHYCPDCDCIYCADHYAILAAFDDGFYDCSWATCPKGHRRMMDD